MTAVVVTTPTTTDTLFYSSSISLPNDILIAKEFSVYEPGGNTEDVQFTNTIDNENKIHLVNTVKKLTGTISSKDTEIEASEFQNWINSHGGEKKLKAFAESNSHSTIIRRKRSTLSYVSYSSSSDDSSDDETDYIPISELKKELNKGPPSTPKPSSKRIIIPEHYNKAKSPSKKGSWFTGLLQKKQGVLIQPESPKNTISAFFNNKKPTTEKKKHIPPPPQLPRLPARYPYPIERAIQQISWMKLSNPKRPLIQQVVISNLIYQYTATIRNQTNALLNKSRKQSVVLNSMMYNNNNQNCKYNIPPRKSSAATRRA